MALIITKERWEVKENFGVPEFRPSRQLRRRDGLNGAATYWSTRTQSFAPVPSVWVPGGVMKFCEPLLAKGEPAMAVEAPVVGSYQEAVMDFVKFAMLTVRVVETGVYTMASVGFQAVVV